MATSTDQKKELKRAYLERPKPAGVFQIKNTANGKVLLGSCLNLDGALNGHRFMLSIGSHRNQTLQKEWKEYGAERFVFEILETVKVSEEPDFNLSDALASLEQTWLERLAPIGGRGYNQSTRIRQA